MSRPPNDLDPDRPEDPRRRIRPYSMTAGRTVPARSDLELEALVSTTRQGKLEAAWLVLERRSIVDFCQETQSIAEISARLGMPVNVTRILVDDLSEGGLVVVYQSPTRGARPSVELLERVLHGLRGL